MNLVLTSSGIMALQMTGLIIASVCVGGGAVAAINILLITRILNKYKPKRR